MNGIRAILFLGLCCAPALLSAKTRQEVISDAAAYASYSWPVERKNLKDVLRCEQGLMIPDLEGDGLDDRGQVGSTETATCAYYPSLWPFVVGSTVTGEAYAWAGWTGSGAIWGADLPGVFTDRLHSSTSRWIAGGRKDSDIPAGGETFMPAGYLGYAGIDCSGLAGNALAINKLTGIDYKHNTVQLMGKALLISTGSLKSGDLLLRYTMASGVPKGIHTILVRQVFADSISVYHATPNKFSTGDYVQRVVSEIIQMRRGDDGRLYLKDAANKNQEFPYYPYSPFPQFAWTTPAYVHPHPLMAPVNQIIELDVVSKSSVAPSSVMLVFDDHLPDATTVYSGMEGFSVTPSSADGRVTVRYAVPSDRLLPQGIHA